MTLYIKNMVCVRCKRAVQSVLEELEIEYTSIELGKAKLTRELSTEEQQKVNIALKRFELELIEDRKKIISSNIKAAIIGFFNSSDVDLRLKFSEYLSDRLRYDYTYLSNIFTEIEGITIERFYIVTRVERVKELIAYEDINLKEIAYQLNYSSVSHLCLQFKKVTGQTPAMFKKLCSSQNYIWKTCE